MWLVLFPFPWNMLTNRHTGFNRGGFFRWLHLGAEILKDMGTIKSLSLSSTSSLYSWKKQSPFLCLMRRKFWAFRLGKLRQKNPQSYSSSLSSSSSLYSWMKQSPFLCLMRRRFCTLKIKQIKHLRWRWVVTPMITHSFLFTHHGVSLCSKKQTFRLLIWFTSDITVHIE